MAADDKPGHLRLVHSEIVARPQRVAFRPERVEISGGGARDWFITDIKIGNVAMPKLTWWQRFKYRVRRLLERLHLVKPYPKRLIGSERE